MRRKEKEITDKSEMESIIRSASVCRLAMVDGSLPYLVPICFGYRDNTLYFHSALKGRKIDILKNNNQVCFEVDIDSEIVKGAEACDWGMRFQSVIGFGTASFVTDPDEKRQALDVIMSQYSEPGDTFRYPDAKLKTTAIIKVGVEEMTGKRG